MKRKLAVVLAAFLMLGIGAVPANAVPAVPNVETDSNGVPHSKPKVKVDLPSPAVGKNINKHPKGRIPKPGQVTTLAAACASPPCYSYAGSYMQSLTDDTDGLGATILVSKPFVRSGDDHSLVELAVSDSTGSTDNTVEIGWNIDPSLNGDSNPHLFVYRWDNGVGQGYNGTGGFQNASGCSPCAGDSINADVNTNKQFAMQYFNDGVGGATDGWWASYNNNYIGVYPETLWTSPTFTAGDYVLAFGEVLTSTYQNTCSDMGSGYAGGHANSTAIQSLTLPGSTDAEDFDNASNKIETASAAWNVSQISDTYIRPGGAGYNSIDGTPGAIGSCAPSSAGTPGASRLEIWMEFCPDGQTSTGCNSGGWYSSGTTVLNACNAMPTNQYDMTVAQNNSGVSGRTYRFWATSGCTGGTSATVGNGASLNPAFEPHGIQRIG